jgi:hypothetical protein
MSSGTDAPGWVPALVDPDTGEFELIPAPLNADGTVVTGADGKSAYEVWLAQPGNAGKSVGEYLLAITGPRGDKGDTGNAGADGAAGSSYLTGQGAPAAGTGNNGDTYEDINTGEVYRKAGGAWTDTGVTVSGKPSLLAYAQATQPQLAIPQAATDLNGLAVTFTPDGRATTRAIWIEAIVPFILNHTAAGIASILLTDNNNALQARAQHSMAVNDQRSLGLLARRRTDLNPGTAYTFKVRANAAAGATIDAYADPTYPAFIRAYYES